MELNGYKATAKSLIKLGSVYEFADSEISSDCLTIREVCESVNSRQKLLFHHQHICACVRCQSWFSLFRGARAVELLPAKWSVDIEPEQKIIEPTFSQTLGFIELDTLEFQSCEEDLLWSPMPFCIRFNLVVDAELQSISLTLLEVPSNVNRVFATIFGKQVLLEASEPKGIFEYCFFEDECFDNSANESHARFFERVFGEKLSLEFEACKPEEEEHSTLPLFQLLEKFGGFENSCQYVLPSGHVSEVHFNLAKLCKHREVLDRLANELETELPQDVDVIVSNSWAMAMVARRIVRLRNLRNRKPSTRDVLCEGYSDPVLTDSIRANERVAIVSDVAVTGKQIKAIGAKVNKRGGQVVSSMAIVIAKGEELDASLNGLLPVDLKIHGANLPQGNKMRLHFNPLANDMTIKKDSRAPSQFLQENEDAADFWQFISQVVTETKGTGIQYYKRHHIESETHYTQFVDTGRLLQHPKFGNYLVERMRDQLAAEAIVPDVIVVPNRSRAELFAKLLATSFEMTHKGPLKILVVSKRRDGFWRFPADSRAALEGKSALIVDTAVGSGKTVDLFGMAASEFRAKRVGVCSILSRLPEAAEIAFAKRFDWGFFRIFNLPTRPVVVRGTSVDECPHCHRRQTLKNAAELSGSEAIQQLASLRRRMVASGAIEPTEAPPKQMVMFDQSSNDDIFETCTPTIAGGITLHSLYAAQNNGMATLILPEIRNKKIPSRNREAMVQDLPIGALHWSRGDLDNDLLSTMEEVELPSLWGASAMALANENYSDWFFQLNSVVERSSRLQKQENSTFWQRLSYSAFMTACDLPESDVASMTSTVRELMETFSDTSAEQGLQKVLESIVNRVQIHEPALEEIS